MQVSTKRANLISWSLILNYLLLLYIDGGYQKDGLILNVKEVAFDWGDCQKCINKIETLERFADLEPFEDVQLVIFIVVDDFKYFKKAVHWYLKVIGRWSLPQP